MVHTVEFKSWGASVAEVLDAAGFLDVFSASGKDFVLLKPNLVSDQPPPVTTHIEILAAVVDYLRERAPDVRVVIAEGTGMKDYDTRYVFESLGAKRMAEEKGVELVDLNESEPLVRLSNPDCSRWPEMWLPKIVMDAFILSIPILKAHSLSDVTLTMKNMMGAAPPKHFDAGSWRKSAFHERVHEAIFDLNRYRTPDFTLLDAVEGMAEAHLWGPECDPPPNKLAASADPVAIDAWGCAELGLDWRSIGHIRMADGVLGNAQRQ